MDQQLPPFAPESEPKVPTSSPQPPQMEKAEDTANSEQSAPVSSISRFVFWLQQYRRLLIILVGGMLILGAIAGLIFMKSKSDTDESSLQNALPQNLNQVRPIESPSGQSTPSSSVPVADSDGDGLIDAEEISLKTDAKKVDSDGDGLTDRQEVQIYQTNPLNVDTDEDGFTDGEEVRNFYNPNGSGKLLDVIDAIEQYNNEK